MKSLKLAVTFIAATLVLTAAAEARHKHRRHHHRGVDSIYLHNYGPGIPPAPFAYYDGPTRALCKQSAAAYRGQDGRRYPCH